MPKDKKKQKVAEGGQVKWHWSDMPSENCKNFLIELVVKFYEDSSLRSLESRYVRYSEGGPEKFKIEMSERMMLALSVPEWIAETCKKGYTKFLEDRAHDSLWNAKDILAKYAKQHRKGDEAFQEVLSKADLFVTLMKPFAKRRNRRGSVGWWNSEEGRCEENIRRAQLMVIPPTSTIVVVENIVRRGGHAIIKKVRFEGVPSILPWWEFAAKLPLTHATRPDLAKLDHQNESLAVRISHPGVIHFVAIHPYEYEGYAYWWNGGTLREMLNRDRNCGEDVFVHYAFGNHSENDIIEARQLLHFRKKRTQLAWALVHIMNEVHKTNNLHNDLSPDNILLHFPTDESKVYIGVCDWSLTTFTTDPRKSPYIFTNVEDMTETLRKQWWVDPRVAYVHKRDADIQIIPDLSKASEEFATAKIAQRINGGSMSIEYHRLQRPRETSVVFNEEDSARTFEIYLNRVCTDQRDSAGGLSHIITRFSDTYHWPVPREHFREAY